MINIKPFKTSGQINLGYQMMYAGIRAEAIWKDANKPYGIGLDLASINKRNTYGDFSILSNSYSTIIGTLYYDFQSNWSVQLDGGRYLAGDYGATFSLSRNFNNGWEIGAYATLTNVKFSTFGEGSFDKGITLKVPLSWFTGKKSQAYSKSVIDLLLEMEELDYIWTMTSFYIAILQNTMKKAFEKIGREFIDDEKIFSPALFNMFILFL